MQAPVTSPQTDVQAIAGAEEDEESENEEGDYVQQQDELETWPALMLNDVVIGNAGWQQSSQHC